MDTKFVYSNSSDPARIWTWNLQIRSQMPYPLGQGAFLRRGQSVEKAWITLKNEKMKSIPNNSFIKLLFLMLPLLKLFVNRAWEIKYLYLSSWLFLFLFLPDFLFSLMLQNSKINLDVFPDGICENICLLHFPFIILHDHSGSILNQFPW